MFRGESGGSATPEALSQTANQEAFDQDPQETEGFLVSESQEIVSFKRKVEVPGSSKPVEYSGSMPVDLNSNFIHIVVPGFGGIKGSYRSFEQSMASREGRFTISFAPARSSSQKLDPQQIHEDSIGAIAQDVADSGVLNELPNGDKINLSEFNGILHSMAAAAGTRRASNYPSEVRSLTFLNPIGFEENPDFARYIKRIGPCTLAEILPGILKGEFKDHRNLLTGINMGKHLFGNVIQTVGEIVTCHTSDLRQDVFRLGKMGVGTAVLLGGSDRLVRAKPSFDGITHYVDHCEIIEDTGHFGPQKQPEETANNVGRVLAKVA
ncbi:hypothetical protein HZB74_03805 [Candidatus Saccharibacteria bacterium]|nr:hypothetical protein [Candidatus Saccharibacteria bacterium]